MQKRIAIALITILIFTNTSLTAQNYTINEHRTAIHKTKNSFEIGIEAGPNLRWFRGSLYLQHLDFTSIGHSAGISLKYNFSEYFSAQFNLIHERKGSVFKIMQLDTLGNLIFSHKVNYNFDYIKSPVLLVFNVKHIHLIAGPYISYLVKAERVNKEAGTKFNQIHLSKKFDTGLTLGIGMLYPIHQKIALSMELRKNLGLYNVSTVPIMNNGTIKTNSVNLLFGIRYQI